MKSQRKRNEKIKKTNECIVNYRCFLELVSNLSGFCAIGSHPFVPCTVSVGDTVRYLGS